jgi:hypothetical protein
VTVTCGFLPEPSAVTISAGTFIPVAVLPPRNNVVRNLMPKTVRLSQTVSSGDVNP